MFHIGTLTGTIIGIRSGSRKQSQIGSEIYLVIYLEIQGSLIAGGNDSIINCSSYHFWQPGMKGKMLAVWSSSEVSG